VRRQRRPRRPALAQQAVSHSAGKRAPTSLRIDDVDAS
jgi:hypothetical protein